MHAAGVLIARRASSSRLRARCSKRYREQGIRCRPVSSTRNGSKTVGTGQVRLPWASSNLTIIDMACQLHQRPLSRQASGHDPRWSSTDPKAYRGAEATRQHHRDLPGGRQRHAHEEAAEKAAARSLRGHHRRAWRCIGRDRWARAWSTTSSCASIRVSRRAGLFPPADLTASLEETHGVMIYQEQVMQIAQILVRLIRWAAPICCGARWARKSSRGDGCSTAG